MSTTIETQVYESKKLIDSIISTAKRNNDLANPKFIKKALSKFGLIKKGLFITTWNEYYDEYNPAINCIVFFETIFGTKSPVWRDSIHEVPSSVERSDVACELNVGELYEKFRDKTYG